jgi:uncharacterized protein YjiS (DUF1127 family)
MAINPTLENPARAYFVRPAFSTRPARTSLVASVRAVFVQWLRLTTTRRELSRLDDRILRDIGFDPQEARLEAAKPFWKPYTLSSTSE